VGLLDTFLGWLGGEPASHKPIDARLSDKEKAAVVASARRSADVLLESLQLAKESRNPSTKMSRLRVAGDMLWELHKLQRTFRSLELSGIDEVEAELNRVREEFYANGIAAVAEGNDSGERLEKEGRIDEALKVYEELATNETDTPFTYQRLAILYRKRKQREDEERVLELALKNVPKRNAQHRAWFEARLKKLRGKD
jgi:tetratricopeptide (TPR) repeat protein